MEVIIDGAKYEVVPVQAQFECTRHEVGVLTPDYVQHLIHKGIVAEMMKNKVTEESTKSLPYGGKLFTAKCFVLKRKSDE